MKHYKIPKGTPLAPFEARFHQRGHWYIHQRYPEWIPSQIDWFFTTDDMLSLDLASQRTLTDTFVYILLPHKVCVPMDANAFYVKEIDIQVGEE